MTPYRRIAIFYELQSSNHRYLLPFYLSYAVGLVVPILLGVVLFVRTNALAEREVDARVEFALERAADSLESIYADVQFIAAQASLSESVGDLSRMSFSEPHTKYRRLLDHVFNPAFVGTASFSRFVSDFFLILPRPGVALTSGGVISLDSLYEYQLALADVPLSEFVSSYLAPEFDFTFRRDRVIAGVPREEQETLLLLHSLPATPSQSDRLLFVLDERELRSELEGASFPEGSAVFVMDERGTILSSLVRETDKFTVGPPPNPRHGDVADWTFPSGAAEYEVRSTGGRIRVVARVAKAVFTTRAAFVRRTTLLFVIVVLAIDTLVILLLSRKNARPLTQMLGALQDELQNRARGLPAEPSTERAGTADETRIRDGGTSLSGLRLMERQLGRLLERTHSIEEELERQQPLMQAIILQGLVQGVRLPQRELDRLLSRAGIDVGHGFLCCVVLSLDPVSGPVTDNVYDELVLKKFAIEELFDRLVSGSMNYLYQSYDQVVLIHSADAATDDSYHSRLVQELRPAVFELREGLAFSVRVGVGNPYRTISRLNTSYEEARMAVEQYAPLSPNQFAVYREYVDSRESYFFPVELELKLLNATRQGDADRLRQAMGQLRATNFEERSLARESILLLFAELKGTIAKLNVSIETAGGRRNDRATAFTQADPAPENWDTFLCEAESVLLSIAELFREQVRSARSGIDRSEVERFLREGFGDPNLSLASIADHFGVTEKYFSRYFKDQFQINFHPYLESIRLEYVRSRMIETDAPIQEIVADSGYASTVTFSRAFKRKYGVNPSTYRNAARTSP